MKKLIVSAAAALVLSGSAGLAATSDISSDRRADFYAPGKHQFYAWCTDGRDRRVAQSGLSAKDAEGKLMGSMAGCRLSWQGRIPA